MVEGEITRIHVLLTVDAGGVAGAVAHFSKGLVRGFGLAVRCCCADVQTPILFIPSGLPDCLDGVGEALVRAGTLAGFLHIGTCFLSLDFLTHNTKIQEHALIVVVGVESKMAGRSKG